MSMKKKRKNLRVKSKNTPAQHSTLKSKVDRRKFLKQMRTGTIAMAVIAGGGYFAVSKVQATIAEHDLSKIGNGRPAIVQIHDPQCPVCLALQRETRDALSAFNQDDFEYLVANIRSKEGSEFANKYFVPHVTVLLFDGQGKLSKILNGPNKSDFLQTEFANHLAGKT
jgi:hypothetical protein